MFPLLGLLICVSDAEFSNSRCIEWNEVLSLLPGGTAAAGERGGLINAHLLAGPGLGQVLYLAKATTCGSNLH